MQRFCACVFLLFSVAIAAPALAASQPATAQQIKCGKTAADALTAARAALASNNSGRERAALSCLIDAIAELDARERSFEQGKQNSGVLAVPQHSDANQRGP